MKKTCCTPICPLLIHWQVVQMITWKHSIWYHKTVSLNNYELTLGDWKIGGAAEDDKQANPIALKPAIRSQIPQKRVNLAFPNIEFWNIILKDNYSYYFS